MCDSDGVLIALFDVSILLNGELPMTCPYCNRPMIPGFIQARSEIYFTQSPHKLLFAAKGNDVVLTKHNNMAPTAVAWHCPTCKKVVVEYGEKA